MMLGTYSVSIGERTVEVYHGISRLPQCEAQRVLDEAARRLREQDAGGVVAPPADAGDPLPEGPPPPVGWQSARPA